MIYRRAKNPRPFDRERALTALAERSGGGGVFERRRRRRSLHHSYQMAGTSKKELSNTSSPTCGDEVGQAGRGRDILNFNSHRLSKKDDVTLVGRRQ